MGEPCEVNFSILTKFVEHVFAKVRHLAAASKNGVDRIDRNTKCT